MAKQKIRALSDQEIQLLQSLLDRARNQNISSRSTGELSDQKDHQEILAPETYMAKTPSTGIPALNSKGSGTGSASAHQGLDVPGYAQCAIYRLLRNPATGMKELVLTSIVKPPVFNLSSIEVPGDVYVGVTRDKFGDWFVGSGVAASSPESGTGSSSSSGSGSGDRPRVTVVTGVCLVTVSSGSSSGSSSSLGGGIGP